MNHGFAPEHVASLAFKDARGAIGISIPGPIVGEGVEHDDQRGGALQNFPSWLEEIRKCWRSVARRDWPAIGNP
jgi:hypothetical protein